MEDLEIYSKKWHISKYILFAENPNNKEEIFGVNLFKCICFSLTKKEFKLLFELNPRENIEKFKKFINLGLVVDFDELTFIQLMNKKGYDFSSILSLSICPTLNCNFNCPYCFEKHRPGKLTDEIQENIILLINKIVENYNIKGLNITWFGGEPLLYPNIIESFSKQLIDYTNLNHIRYSASIITNGYLLTQEIADTLYRAKVKKYQITLDGVGKVHDYTRHLINGNPTFEKIIDNLNNIRISGSISIRHNIHKDNYNDIPKLKNYLKNLENKYHNNISYYYSDITRNENTESIQNDMVVSQYNFGKIKILNNDISNLNNIFKYCGACGLNFITIDEEGRLFKCRDIVGNNELSFGNVKTWDPINPFLSADNPNMIMSYINASGALYDEECKKCIWLPYCGGGCPQQRIFYQKKCTPYKNNENDFVLGIAKKYLK